MVGPGGLKWTNPTVGNGDHWTGALPMGQKEYKDHDCVGHGKNTMYSFAQHEVQPVKGSQGDSPRSLSHPL